MNITYREMQPEDYNEVYALWMTISGFGIRSIDDSEAYIARFLVRNPGLSVVALAEGKIVGSILCGHDGRTGCFYHVCVAEEYRNQNIGRTMVSFCMRALQADGISKVTLIAYRRNSIGNQFWKDAGWEFHEDVNYYSFILNEENITRFNS